MSQRPDFRPDTSGPYLKPRLIPKRPDQPPSPARVDAGPSTQDSEGGARRDDGAGTDEEGERGALAARTHRWFEDTVVVPDEFRALLVEYSHILPDEVDEHVLQVVSSSSPVVTPLQT